MRASGWWLAVGAAALLAACGGDGTGPQDDGIPAGLVGTWLAGASCHPRCHLTLFDRADPSDSVNLVAFGVSVQMRIRSSGQLAMTAGGPTGSDVLLEGSLEVRGGRMIVTGDEGVDTLTYTLRADTLEAEVTSQLLYNGESIGLRTRMIRQ